MKMKVEHTRLVLRVWWVKTNHFKKEVICFQRQWYTAITHLTVQIINMRNDKLYIRKQIDNISNFLAFLLLLYIPSCKSGCLGNVWPQHLSLKATFMIQHIRYSLHENVRLWLWVLNINVIHFVILRCQSLPTKTKRKHSCSHIILVRIYV